MVATDGHRLSMIERDVDGFKLEGGAIIPRKGLQELRKLLDQPVPLWLPAYKIE
jgi:DNA polymerase III sliding clamp (beta) subunit (PCNA family)